MRARARGTQNFSSQTKVFDDYAVSIRAMTSDLHKEAYLLIRYQDAPTGGFPSGDGYYCQFVVDTNNIGWLKIYKQVDGGSYTHLKARDRAKSAPPGSSISVDM